MQYDPPHRRTATLSDSLLRRPFTDFKAWVERDLFGIVMTRIPPSKSQPI